MIFDLPPEISDLVKARNNLRKRFEEYGLSFTFDGKLVGDIGEALAADIFGIKLIGGSNIGVDGHTADGRSVQVKASCTFRGPAFRAIDANSEHLLFFHLHMDDAKAELVFNGPEKIALACIRKPWNGQRMISVSKIREANSLVLEQHRLKPKKY